MHPYKRTFTVHRVTVSPAQRQQIRRILKRALEAEIGIKVRIRASEPRPEITRRAREQLREVIRAAPGEFGSLATRLDPQTPAEIVWVYKAGRTGE